MDKVTGKGIYGAVFLLYDSNHNPIGEYVTDQDGYIYADEGLADGRYYLREIKAAPGYVLDPELKTIYVRYGSTTEIEWSNTAECGQIQIIKKSADDNATNGLPAGTLLEGAVFEIYDKVGMWWTPSSLTATDAPFPRRCRCPAIPSVRSKRPQITPLTPQ